MPGGIKCPWTSPDIFWPLTVVGELVIAGFFGVLRIGWEGTKKKHKHEIRNGEVTKRRATKKGPPS